MNCREFRRKHDAYIDDTLSGVDIDGMAHHRRFCEQCAQLDTRVRRALLVAHNLPTIQPSAHFNERLQARLAVERELMRARRDAAPSVMWRLLGAGTYSALAAGLLVAAGLATVAVFTEERDEVIRLAPVVATRPEPTPSAFATPTMVAAMPAGMPLWSAVVDAQQAPWHFAVDATGR